MCSIVIGADIVEYNNTYIWEEKDIVDYLSHIIDASLPTSTSKVRHAHPVWFLNDNPIVWYSKQKQWIRLMFWSGKDFGEEKLSVVWKKFQDASCFYTQMSALDKTDLARWLHKAQLIQRDYKNIVKRKGKLEKLTDF